jgi:solute carrier family 25 (mitochondrial adenine nucleotide translocator), member 4/5/6/31
MTAEMISYPGDTVKRKMMMQSHKVVKDYTGVLDCFAKLYKAEGLPGFWRGAYSNILRGLGSAVCLILFDEMKKLGHDAANNRKKE